MALEPFCSLTPLSPVFDSYDPADPGKISAWGCVYSYGGHTNHHPGFRLRDNYNIDEIIVGWDAVRLDQVPWQDGDHLYRNCTVEVYLQGHNVTTENQYLMVFGIERRWGLPSAQFVVGTEVVSTKELKNDLQHAILLPSPGHAKQIRVCVRLLSPDFQDMMAFKGVDCYLL